MRKKSSEPGPSPGIGAASGRGRDVFAASGVSHLALQSAYGLLARKMDKPNKTT